jgi:hypothetical protein
MDRRFWFKDNPLRIQYLGESGYPPLCLLAIDAILQDGCLPEKATIVSTPPPPWEGGRRQEHLFLFWNWWHFPLIIVPNGFSSGYSGEGPKAFSLAICMIRSKKIPLEGIFVTRSQFGNINEGRLGSIDAPILQKIKTRGELLPFPFPDWVSDEDEQLLERGQLWRKFYWRKPKIDCITEAIGNIDAHIPEVGRKLRLAVDKLKIDKKEEWQSAMIHIRDAWIELAQRLCDLKTLDTSNLQTDAVVDRLKKLKIDKTDERLFNLARASFNLSMKHHARKIDIDTATACVISTIVSMQTVIREAFNAKPQS